MQIYIKVKPGAKKKEVLKISENNFIVNVKERAVENKANLAVIKALADYFDISKSRVKIISGLKSKTKTVLVERSL